MTDNSDQNKNQQKLTRRQFLIYSSAASAVAVGVVLKTDAQQAQIQALAPGIDPTHTIYGYS